MKFHGVDWVCQAQKYFDFSPQDIPGNSRAHGPVQSSDGAAA